MPLTIGSLFSGIGGLELGLERGIGDGCHTVFQVEQDEYCRAVLAKHWPNAKRYEDVRNVGRETLEAVDIICGGFPCQDISSAGKRAGIRGERSGLWSEYARIVRELRPSYVVVENVAMLLADGLGVVLGDLAEIGYDAEWDCISAAAVGAPHRRDRIFVVAHANCRGLVWPRSAQGPQDAWTDRRHDARRSGSVLAHAQRRRREGGIQQRPKQTTEFATALRCDRGGNSLGRSWESEPRVGRVAHGVPARLVAPAIRALGNAVVPQVAEVVGRLIAEREKELRGAA